MDIFSNLGMGFSVALTSTNIYFCLIGVTLGTLIGVLPGIGTSATLAMLMPITFGMNPTSAMIMMCGIYYGAMYGGSTTSILVSIPGESSSVMTCLDGYQMAKKGQAGPALAMAAIASFIAGTISIVFMMFVAAELASLAIHFGPADYFSLMLVGLSAVAYLGGGSLAKALLMAAFGIFVSTIGVDVVTGADRFSYNNVELLDGIDFLVLIMGFFAVSEVLLSLEKTGEKKEVFKFPTTLRELWPSKADMRHSIAPISRGTIIGFLIGALPGAGASIAAFLSYGIEKKVGKRKDLLGTGIIEGIAAPEGANNAAATGALVPLLSLGIPGSGSAAIMLGALVMMNVRPGPMLFVEQPQLVWGIIASMYVGNVMLLILNLPMVPLLAQLLRVPYFILYPVILLFTFLGVYSINNSIFDVQMLLIFSILGYVLRKMKFHLAPAVLGIVLGPMMEVALRSALILSQGSWLTFIKEPISLSLLIAMVLLYTSKYLLKGIKFITGQSTQKGNS